MSNLKNLKNLKMSWNNLSEGLPDVVTSMTSLRKLDMFNCNLPALPERLEKPTSYEIFIQ